MASKGDINKNEVQPLLSKKWKIVDFEKSLRKTGSFTKLKSIQFFAEGIYPIVDQGDNRNSGFVNDPELLYKGEIPVVIFGDHTRNIKYVDYQFGVGADGTKILRPINEINTKFFFYYLRALNIPSFGYSRHFKVLKEIDVPVPPLPEQERIVAKLDSVFAHMEEAKQGLEKIPVLLKEFRQAVLTQAVTGKLTEEWREGKIIEEWETKTLKDITKMDVGYAFKSNEFVSSGIRLLRGQNIEPGSLRWTDTQYFPEIKLKDLKHLFINEGDVILAMDRPIVSNGLKLAIAEKSDLPCVLVQRVARFTETNDIINKFLSYIIGSQDCIRHLFSNQTGSQIPHISGDQILKYTLKVPTIQEQTEIVSRVEALFSKADAIEAQYKKLKVQINQLPQAVLAKAFRGEV